jgi:SAM-dependent methyltransferase
MLTIDQDRLEVVEGDRVLDLGCGNGRHSYEVQRRGGIPVAVDLDVDALRLTKDLMAAVAAEEGTTKGTALVADALRLPFPDRSFDHVIASEVLEHIPRDSLAMGEIARVLKIGGTAAVSVPRFWPETVCWSLSRGYHDNEGGHVRIYRRSQLLQRLAAQGLRPYAMHHAHALHSPYWWLRCAFGVDNEDALLPRRYHGFLVWDIENPNRAVRAFERAMDPLLGKSLCVYLRKEGARVYA